MSTLIIVLALILDYFFGELPNHLHPLVGFGNMAHILEKRWNQSCNSSRYRFWMGLSALLLLVIVPVFLVFILLIVLPLWVNILLQLLVLWFCIGWRSLSAHAKAISFLLSISNVMAAREALAFIVSRDTEQLSERKVAAATIESVLENGSDAVFASIFWFVVGGAPAALAHRLINTLDAMWGYRNQRFNYFGKSAAILDDVMNYIPSRLTALSYALVSHHIKTAFVCWINQAKCHSSPNAGVVMAAGAGALAIRLGGSARYDGILEVRPVFGIGRSAKMEDIEDSLLLINKSLLLWLVVLVAL